MTEPSVEEVRASTKASVHELAPLVTLDPPVAVEVWDAWRKEWFTGQVVAYRGPRVSVRYSSGLGMTHIAWLPADCVKRLDNDEEAPASTPG